MGAGPRMEWGALRGSPCADSGLGVCVRVRTCASMPEVWRGASLVPSPAPSPACGGAGGASKGREHLGWVVGAGARCCGARAGVRAAVSKEPLPPSSRVGGRVWVHPWGLGSCFCVPCGCRRAVASWGCERGTALCLQPFSDSRLCPVGPATATRLEALFVYLGLSAWSVSVTGICWSPALSVSPCATLRGAGCLGTSPPRVRWCDIPVCARCLCRV